MLDIKSLPADPYEWRCEDVAVWLKKIGMAKYADLIATKHKVDGKCLLALTDTDLKDPPVSINCLGDIKKILFAIGTLTDRVVEISNPSVSHHRPSSNGHGHQLKGGKDGLLVEYNEQNHLSISGEDVVTTTRRAEIVQDEETLLDTLAKSTDGTSTVQLISREEIIRQVERPDTYFKSIAKLLIAFAYSSLSFLMTSFVMVLVHDRVPDTKTYPPLPDLVLDNVPHIPWAFDMCETIGLVLAVVWFTVLFFHRERVIIARRMFSLLGTVFLLRCFTMLITSLSVPGIHLQCEARPNTTMQEKLHKAFHIWSNLGMSLHGVRSCGDYMFSGHTTVITMISHFITEYTPADWTGLHTFTWVLNCFAIFLILAAHEHYSIDVFIAFYISSRMFLYYHAYAYNHAGITATDYRMRTWFPLGWFFEYGSQGKVENEFSLPIDIRIPRRIFFAKPEEPKLSPKPENGRKKSSVVASKQNGNGNCKNHKKHN
uniref:SAM domain-containing protein n=1 Tax=Caenorhabditis tropicalis TaxID=1561998 RepID=A0A1I7UAN2_9PELO